MVRRLFVVDKRYRNYDSMVCACLPHPKYDQAARYMIAEYSSKTTRPSTMFMEVQSVAPNDTLSSSASSSSPAPTPSSWFIDNSVESDGRMYIATVVDPLFLAIPYLQKNYSNGFSPIDQILVSDKWPQIRKLQLALSDEQLSLVCDVTEGWDDKVFRLNTDKMLAWLLRKVEALANQLITYRSYQPPSYKTSASVSSPAPASASASTHASSSSDNPQHLSLSALSSLSRSAVIAALGVLQEYLSKDNTQSLLNSPSVSALNISMNQLFPPKRSRSKFNVQSVSADADHGDVDVSEVKESLDIMDQREGSKAGSKKKKPSANALRAKSSKSGAAKKLNGKGMRSISSFFGGMGKKKKSSK